MDKVCGYCGTKKPLGEFFATPNNGRASSVGSSAFCKQCHAEGKIAHGYGWYGDKYKTPDETK